ncbi:MAG: hypothetical protein LBK73_08280 [Treponema sp.]|nr:hypothetical protein [Treponema sp.]
MDGNEIIRWRYDRGKGGNAKGMDVLAGFCTEEDECGKPQVPEDCQMTAKAEADGETGEERRAGGRCGDT